MVKKKVSEMIKKLRKTTGWTQEGLAQKLGVSFVSVNHWENGKRNPSPLALRQIEKIAAENGIKTKS